MKNMKELRLSIATIAISVSVAAIIITCGFIIKGKSKDPEVWVLHSYGNNVALYNGDKIVEVYGGIVLDTLPLDDKRQLDNGIAFPTREEAVSAVEDYDG
jgi:hypothetical protein